MSFQRARLTALAALFALALILVASNQLLNEGHWVGWLGIPAAIAVIAVTGYELLRRRDDS